MRASVLLACLTLIFGSGSLFAQEGPRSDDPERLPDDRDRTISDLLRRVEALEAEREARDGRADLPGEEKEEGPSWTERITPKGDFRYRHEYIRIDREGQTDKRRHRHRLRARLGLVANLSDDLDLGFGISTGEAVDANGRDEGDPISNNQTLSDAWSLKNIWISEAYFDWHPGMAPGLAVMGGKVKRPFITPVKSELIWDSDVFPEGAVVKYDGAFGSAEVFARGYGFWIIERGANAESGLLGGQGAVKINLALFEGPAHILGGLSYYDYLHVEGETFFVDADPFGNTPDASGTAFEEDYNIFEAFLEVGTGAAGLPVALFGDYVNNTAVSRLDEGWSVGVQVGKAKKPGSWQVRYLYKKVERDAVFGTFVDSDFGGGGTNSKGHEINVSYQIASYWNVGATYFYNQVDIAPGEPEDPFQRGQLDLRFRF